MELVAHGLCKTFADRQALAGVSLSAGSGVLALLGPNGSGKTTLLRLLATAAKPDAGEIALGGRPYSGDLRPIRRVLGYMPQALEFPDHLTARQFLHYMAQLKGVPPEPTVGALLNEVGLGEALGGRPLRELSGGQVRRVGLAQALLANPRLLLLDEPTAGLDPEERDRALGLIGRPASGRIAVFSSHVPGEVEAIAGQVVVLRGGRVLYAGTVEHMRRMAIGHVWEAVVPAISVEQMLQSHRISRVTNHGTEAVLRVVGDAPPPGLRAAPVDGSLEDAYLLLQTTA